MEVQPLDRPLGPDGLTQECTTARLTSGAVKGAAGAERSEGTLDWPTQRPTINRTSGAPRALRWRGGAFQAWVVTSKNSGGSPCTSTAWSLAIRSARVSNEHLACSSVSQVLTVMNCPVVRSTPIIRL